MRSILPTFLLALVSCMTTVVSHAGETHAESNAALWYWRAIAALNEHFEEWQGERSNLDELLGEAALGDIAPELEQLIRDANQMEIELLRGSQQSNCAFAIDRECGYASLLPHAAPMRRCAAIVAARAHLAIDEGSIDEAVQRTILLIRMASHISQDRQIISALSASNYLALADRLVPRVAKHAQLSDAARKELRQAIAGLNQHDPASIIIALRSERELIDDWLRAELNTDTAVESFLEFLGVLSGAGEPRPTWVTVDALRQMIEVAVDMMNQMLAAFEVPTADARAEEIANLEASFESEAADPFSPQALALILMPPFQPLNQHLSMNQERVTAWMALLGDSE